MVLELILLILAALALTAAAFTVTDKRVGLGWLGLALFVVAVIVTKV